MWLQTLHRSVAVFCLVSLAAGLAHSQDAGESILVRARRRATAEKKPEDALRMLSDHLAGHPGDSDALVMQGLILSWNGRYDEARGSLQTVLARSPDYSDAVLALFNVEMWSGNPDRAAQLAREAIERRPGYEPYVEGQRKALARMESDLMEAKSGAKAGWRELRDGPSWQAVASQSVTVFSDGRSPWFEEQVGIKSLTSRGSFQLRGSQSNQYGYSSQLVEFDAYPRIRPGTYGFVNVGYSHDHNLYAHYRLGGELFQFLGHGFEVSAGFRRLWFKQAVQVYTGSLTKYKGNWFFSIRPYITPDSQLGASRSVQFWVRRYFGEGTNYIGARYGRGASPFEIRSTLETGVLSSNTFIAEWNWVPARRLVFSMLAGTSKEDRLERAGLGQHFISGTLSLKF